MLGWYSPVGQISGDLSPCCRGDGGILCPSKTTPHPPAPPPQLLSPPQVQIPFPHYPTFAMLTAGLETGGFVPGPEAWLLGAQNPLA